MEMFDHKKHLAASITRSLVAVAVALCLSPVSGQAQEQHAVDSGEAENLESVVVTARRREESLQDIPIAVTALSADELERQQVVSTTDLDKIAPDNPVFLTRADGHAAVANTAALTLAKIDRNTPNPFGGEILRDKQTGEATGIFLDHAEDMVRKNIPPPTPAEREEALIAGIDREIKLPLPDMPV